MKELDTIDYYLKISWQSIANKYNQIAAEYGITHAFGYLLMNVAKEGTTVSQLAGLLGQKATSLSRLLNSMEEMGMIYRETDIHDKRLVKIFLTPLGIEKRKVASGVVKKFNEYLAENLTESEKMVCIEALQKINRLAQDYQPEED
ncbi:MarR family winged helix-turn-helix transcriptional regulator [Solitalea canadensis]|uniref:Transcriptional regulator n=1 Tax=Solitalea canadensis (strain ATCC 29591 / DSM 3403 / JCM 21819 / LMG 8368 / NBRC 15130 / NCIMB 12057 / USAM 9D) TaxID=929556 RepID=H8KNM4_SOLCM|nr:MarR family transcriptional regulator [Solitalea canadensis]AFD08157.1 transcriptional regulator [Solitalea canadensis DSM 3403]